MLAITRIVAAVIGPASVMAADSAGIKAPLHCTADPDTAGTVVATLGFTAISLGGEPADLGKGPAKIKLFFESDAEDRYAELYTNVDLASGVLQIHEKDPEYRSALIHALRPE
jgi:hypothetical protein